MGLPAISHQPSAISHQPSENRVRSRVGLTLRVGGVRWSGLCRLSTLSPHLRAGLFMFRRCAAGVQSVWC